MKTYAVTFTVEGAGEFPLDMLRHDHCYPRSEVDANTAQDRAQGRRKVTLVAPCRQRFWTPTAGRWTSYGWTVSDVSEEPRS